jgi:hypothetical protein
VNCDFLEGSGVAVEEERDLGVVEGARGPLGVVRGGRDWLRDAILVGCVWGNRRDF